MEQEIYSKFKPVELNEIFALAKSGEKPIGPLKLMLSNGHTVAGSLIRSQVDAWGAWNLLLRPVDDMGRSAEGIMFIPSYSVTAIFVESLETAVRDFGFGSVDLDDISKPKSSLELKRHLSAVLESLQKFFENKIEVDFNFTVSAEDSDSRRRSISSFVDGLNDALQMIMADQFSRDSIFKTVTKVDVSEKRPASIQFSSGILAIAANFEDQFGGFQKSQLKSAIESVL